MTEAVEHSQDWSSEHTRRWQSLGDELRRRLGPGAALDPHAREHFGGRLGGDVSGAMVHRSPLAGHLARAVGAQAVTAGSHIIGTAEDLDPQTPAGAALLGHELSHVLQRDVSAAGEESALAVERQLATESHAAAAGGSTGGVDVDALAERVYDRIVDELRREQERGAWVG